MAKKVSYLDNIKKEIADRGRAADRAAKASYEARYGIEGIKQPGAQARASKTAQTRRNATGQLLGAVLQGRRYDEKGRLITASPTNKKNPAKQVGKATPMNATKKIAAMAKANGMTTKEYSKRINQKPATKKK
jgi:hypothetical protein